MRVVPLGGASRSPVRDAGQPVSALPDEQRGVRHHVHPGPHHLARPGGEQRRVSPHLHALPVRLRHQRLQHRGRDRGIDLDGGGPGSLRLGDRHGPIGARGDARSPGRRPGRDAAAAASGPGVGEELGPRHERGVVDRRATRCRPRAPRAPARRARGRHRPCPAPWSRRRAARSGGAARRPVAPIAGARIGGEVHVGVDQAGDHPAAPQVQHLRAPAGGSAERRRTGRRSGRPEEHASGPAGCGAPVPSITVTWARATTGTTRVGGVPDWAGPRGRRDERRHAKPAPGGPNRDIGMARTARPSYLKVTATGVGEGSDGNPPALIECLQQDGSGI